MSARAPVVVGDPAPWVLLGVGAFGVAIVASVWLGGSLASVASGHAWAPPAFGFGFVAELVHQPHQVWPGTPADLIAASSFIVALFSCAIVAVPIGFWLRSRPVAGDPLHSLALAADLTGLAPRGIQQRARSLRPSVKAAKTVAPPEAGLPLGKLVGPRGRATIPLRSSWEDVLLAVMAPRAGKTTALAVPTVLEAPGAVVATSNKSDLWAVTQADRWRHGRVWTFDPQRIVRQPQDWWWNPLADVTTVEAAHRLAQHFVMSRADRGPGGSGSDFSEKAAQELITALLLAAGCAEATLDDVYEWLTDSSARTPAAHLEHHGHLAVALSLRGMQTGARETREGIYQTARTAAQCLRDPGILAWVTPSPVPSITPAAFVNSRDSLYLLSKDGAGSAAPLIAALTDAVFRAGVTAAEREGGRLDPPLVAVLDEAANICRIADLPDLYSHLGSRGVIPVTILQSYKQGVRVWGEPGMDALWSAATVKVIGAGIDDARTAEDISRLVGDHDVPSVTTSRSTGSYSTTIVQRRQRILGAEDVRALPRGRALMLVTGARAAMLQLCPWYDGPDATRLANDVSVAEALLRARARSMSEF